MIYAWTGATGSGKTFHMIKTAYRYWLAGYDIYSNTILFFENYGGTAGCNIVDQPKYFSRLERMFFFLKRLWGRTFKIEIEANRRGKIFYFQDISEILEARNGVIIFDEAQVLFNARLWESLPSEFQYKLQQSRKHKLDLFCTTQNLGTIDITYRRLIHEWFHMEEVLALGRFRLHRINYKDIDELFNDVDDRRVPVITTKYLTISPFSPVLYDTLFDIGFRRFKTLWLSTWDEKTKKYKSAWMIMPKQMSLAEGRKAISSLSLALSPRTSSSYKRT